MENVKLDRKKTIETLRKMVKDAKERADETDNAEHRSIDLGIIEAAHYMMLCISKGNLDA